MNIANFLPPLTPDTQGIELQLKSKKPEPHIEFLPVSIVKAQNLALFTTKIQMAKEIGLDCETYCIHVEKVAVYPKTNKKVLKQKNAVLHGQTSLALMIDSKPSEPTIKEVLIKPKKYPHWKGTVRLVQVFIPGDRAWVLDLKTLSGRQALTALISRLTDFSLTVYIHNLTFEYTYFKTHFKCEIARPRCTMTLNQVRVAGLYKFLTLKMSQHDVNSLKGVARHYGLILDKTEQKSDWSSPTLSASQLNYSAIDAFACYAVGKLLEADVIPVKPRHYATEMQGAIVCAKLSSNGLPTELNRLKTLLKTYENLADNLQEACEFLPQFVEYFKPVNLRSPQQVVEFISTAFAQIESTNGTYLELVKYGLGVIFWKLWFNPKLKSASLLSWHIEHYFRVAYPEAKLFLVQIYQLTAFLRLLSDYKSAAYRVGKIQEFIRYFKPTYSDGENVWGAVHGTFRSLASQGEGRTSCSNAALQNISKQDSLAYAYQVPSVRSQFVAPPNYKILKYDLAGSHLELARVFSGDPVLAKAKKEGIKVHYLTTQGILAREGLNLTIDQVIARHKANDPLIKKTYAIAKTVIYSFLNWAGGSTLHATFLGYGSWVPVEDCQKYIDSCHATYHVLSDYIRLQERLARRKTYKSNGNFFYDLHLPDGSIQTLEASRASDGGIYYKKPKIASTRWLRVEGTIIKRAAYWIEYQAKKDWNLPRLDPHYPNVFLSHLVHDEIVVCIHESLAEKLVTPIVEKIESEFRVYVPDYKGDEGDNYLAYLQDSWG